MVRLEWDRVGDRAFDHGLDRGILYVDGEPYVWNGLRAVDVSPSTDIRQHYLDGFVRMNRVVTNNYKVTISAFTYPDIFESLLGNYNYNGLIHNNGVGKTFSMSWRTSRSTSSGDVHKIHFITNAVIVPTSRKHQTDTDTSVVEEFSWEALLSHTGSDSRPLSYYSLDMGGVPKKYIDDINIYLYGDVTYSPSEPSYDTIKDILSDRLKLKVNTSDTGLYTLSVGGIDLTGSLSNGIYTPTSESTLTANNGIYVVGGANGV